MNDTKRNNKEKKPEPHDFILNETKYENPGKKCWKDGFYSLFLYFIVYYVYERAGAVVVVVATGTAGLM